MSAVPKRPAPTQTRLATSWAIRLFDEMNSLDLPMKREIVLLMGQMITNELLRSPQLLPSIGERGLKYDNAPSVEDE